MAINYFKFCFIPCSWPFRLLFCNIIRYYTCRYLRNKGLFNIFRDNCYCCHIKTYYLFNNRKHKRRKGCFQGICHWCLSVISDQCYDSFNNCCSFILYYSDACQSIFYCRNNCSPLLMYSIRVIRLLIIFLNRNISIFYLILYLCALEILPVLIVVKYFTGLV